ncbi:MAG TPA: ribosome recycling factor [Candidatus Paceibacterota bacterium]|nr:ribosome recycling factor [Candidatus Paceibacterota bacterium]
MYQELIKQRRADFDAAFEHARKEASAIRTGRANPDMVSELKLQYAGSEMRVKEVASIATPDARSIVIQPWDKAALEDIERAIRDSDLGMNPVVDGTSVRLTVPSLTEERRKEYVRLLHQKIEEARIRIRQTREEILKKVQAAVREKTAREDDVRRAKEELQKVVDELHGKLEELKERKEAELMSA